MRIIKPVKLIIEGTKKITKKVEVFFKWLVLFSLAGVLLLSGIQIIKFMAACINSAGEICSVFEKESPKIEYVDIQLISDWIEPVALKIPKEYMWKWWKDGEQSSVRIDVEHWTLEPWRKFKGKKKQVREKLPEPRMDMIILRGGGVPLERQRKVLYSLNKMYGYEEVSSDVAGLRKYGCPIVKMEGWCHKVLYSFEDNERILWMWCPQTGPDAWACSVNSYFNNQVKVEFSVVRSEIKNWRLVWQNVDKLVASFIVQK